MPLSTGTDFVARTEMTTRASAPIYERDTKGHWPPARSDDQRSSNNNIDKTKKRRSGAILVGEDDVVLRRALCA